MAHRAIVLILTLLSAGCVHRAVPALTGRSTSRANRNFLLLMIADTGKARGIAHPCSEKHLHEDLTTLCGQIVDLRTQEALVMTEWLSDWFATSASAGDRFATPSELAALDGPPFEELFLRLMIRQDSSELRTAQACVRGAAAPQLIDFCETVARARTVEVHLMRMRLCQWYNRCD